MRDVEQQKSKSAITVAASGHAAGDVDDEKWVCDSSVDHKGSLPLRASTGAWKASLFIIAIEFSERLTYFGLATSLILYLTKVLHQDLKTAAKNVNYWSGVTTLMPLLGGFIADAYLGRFWSIFFSSIIYLMGLLLMTLSRYVPNLNPCEGNGECHDHESNRVHEFVFFLAIYLVSIGTGGHKPSLESFGADQFDDDHTEERKKKMSFFNWWNFALCSGLVLGVTVIVYVQDHVSWGAADIILTASMAIAAVIFLVGRPLYRYRAPEGSPLIPMLQVIVASIAKRKLSPPSSAAAELHEVQISGKAQKRFLCHTKALKFFDKAAILENGNGEGQSPWRLATVTKVEELKLVINMIPIWMTSLPFGICVAQAATFFIKQGANMNLRLTNDFKLPTASIYSMTALGMIISVTFYEKILVPFLRKTTGNERGLKVLQRIGTGMIFSVAAMVTAAIVEMKRLNVVEQENNSLSMSVFWLAPQFLILGLGDGFTLVGLQEYFYDQVPDSMRSLGIAFYLSVIGAGNFLSSLLITIVDRITEKAGGNGWIGKDINNSRLDNFYWVLAAINLVNLFVYIYVARRYNYKNVQGRAATAVADCYEGDDKEETMA